MRKEISSSSKPLPKTDTFYFCLRLLHNGIPMICGSDVQSF
jgi:hypothetical protein